MMMFVGSIAGRLLPVYAEDEETPGEETQNVEEINEEPEEEEEPEPVLNEETLSWTLRYELGEDSYYPDERTLEDTVNNSNPEAVFTLFGDFPIREGYTGDGWKVWLEDDPDHGITCEAGETIDPAQFSETGGVIIVEPLWLKLFTVTVIYELNCTDAQLEEPYNETNQILFEDQTRKSFDIRIQASAEGKIFAGWTEEADSGVLLNDEESMMNLADRIIEQNLTEITLYGVWEDAEPDIPEEEKKYHVIYRSTTTDCVFPDTDTYEWEQGLYTQQEYDPAEEVIINQEVTRTGYTLIGWALSQEEADAEVIAYHNGDEPGKVFENTDQDLILYTVWEAQEVYTLRCYVNKGVLEDTPANKNGIAVKKITVEEFDTIVITRNGYDFAGWFADSKFKTPVTADTFREDPKSMKLYAKWTAKKYKIYFDLNDEGKTDVVITGADLVSDEEYDAVKEGFIYNKTQKLTPKAKAPGYTFLGWSPDPQADTAKYKAGETYKNYSKDGEDVTLYAVWKLRTYKLKIYVKGGTYGDVSALGLRTVKVKNGVVSTTYTAEDKRQLMYVLLPMMNSESTLEYAGFFTRPGYTFEGWYKDKDRKNKITGDTEFQDLKNYRVYAKWTGVQYTVRLNANGLDAYLKDEQGSRVSSLDKTVTYNKQTKITDVPVREGYTFLGWSLNPDTTTKSGVKYTKDNKYKKFGQKIPETGDIVELYAVWQRKKGTLASGLNYITYNGVKLAVYRAPEGYSLQMLSAGEGNLKSIKYFDDPNLIITAAVNANYFQMRQDTADPYGTHYGVEQTYNGVDLAPKQSGLISYYQKNDGETGWTRSDQYYLQNSDVIFACTPYSVLRHHGKSVNARSYALMNKENTAAFQTMVMRVNGVWCLVVSRTPTYPRTMMKYAESHNAEEAILMDGGGSTQMMAYAEGMYKEVQYTGRAIPNVFCIAKEK
ncbi:MAG: InlB B-repeat-containing protein [Solobacterium sp.]|nr:InlB B-repeat-containing protein [Solobacterium sp.]